MTLYVPLTSPIERARFELAAWCRFDAERRALYALWASSPAQRPRWWVRPPLATEGLDWDVAQRRWVWATGACHHLEVHTINPAQAVARIAGDAEARFLAWDLSQPTISMIPTSDLLAVYGETNRRERRGDSDPCRRARKALGHRVGGARVSRSASHSLSELPLVDRDALRGPYAAKIDELDAP